MKRLFRRGAFLGVPVLLLVAVAAAAGSGPTNRIRHTQAMIESFAMSGSTVAYDTAGVPFPRCNMVLAWNVNTGTVKRASGKMTCGADTTSSGGVRQVAIAGKRIAWIANAGGNSEIEDSLRTAALPRPKERQLGSALRSGDAHGGILMGKWIGNLVGSGDLLAVNRWVTSANGAVTRSELDVIAKGGLRRVGSGPNTIAGKAADSGRIAVLRSNGSVGIYGAGGTLLRQVKPASAKEIALRGDRLLVLTKTNTLAIYNARSGVFVRSWPLPDRAASLDTYGGVAVYGEYAQYSAEPYKVHVLGLASGKDVVIANGTQSLLRSIELEAPGLVYEKDAFTLVFIPFRSVRATVSSP